MPVYYRQSGQPGCGGCLLVALLLMLVTGGAPFVLNLLGFLFSLLLILPVGAFLLFFLFSWYVKKQISSYEKTQTESHNRFVTLLIHILVKIAQIDGEVTKEETSIINEFFRQNLRYNQQQMFWVKEIVKEALASTESLDNLLTEFRNRFAYEPRLILVELIYQILFTKEEPPQAELDIASRIANFLGISYYEQQSIFGKYRNRSHHTTSTGGDDRRYYEILGLEPGVDFPAVKKAYRKLSMQYHPDKVAHLGDEFKGVAEEKMKEINGAYQYLRKKLAG